MSRERCCSATQNGKLKLSVAGRLTDVLDDLELSREAHLVIRNGTLVPGDARLDETDVIEVRPVISGG